jgi:cobalt/nickel transport system permease protein
MLTGSLFLRTTARAQRICQAMYCRGFTGQIHLARQLRWTARDTLFTAGFTLFFALLRFTNPAYLLGKVITDLFK